MAYWIFVINDTDEVFAERVRERKWPIFVHTPNRKNLNVGDIAIFYKAGIGGKKFLGSAKINSSMERKTIDFSLNLTDVVVWDESVDVVSLLDKLEFVKDKISWGLYFQGGVRSINENDYMAIVNSVNNKGGSHDWHKYK